MKPLLLLFLSLLLTALLFAESVTYTGKITDTEGKPVSGALVSDGIQQVFSSGEGSFIISTSADSLHIRRLGFQPLNIPCRYFASPIILPSEPIVLPTVRVTESAWDIISAPPDRIALPIDPDRHYYSANEILSSAPAVHSNDVQLKGEQQNISLLGNLSRHSLIVLDGIPLNPDGESYDLSLLEPENIASIEIIKNNASVYGGGSAIGGVVQITSKQGSLRKGEQISLTSELGSFGYAKNTLTFSTTQPLWNLRLNLGNLNTDNDFRFSLPEWWAADSTAIRANNAKLQNSVSASLGTRIGEARLTLQSDLTSFRRELPGTVNFADVYRNAFLDGYANRNRLDLNTTLLGCASQSLLWLNLDSTLYDNTRAPLAVYLSQYRQKMYNLGLRSTLGRELTLSPTLTLNAGLAAEAGAERYQNLNLLVSGADLDHFSRFANASGKSGFQLDSGDFIWNCSAALRYDYAGDEDNLTWRLESSLQHFSWVESTLGATLGTSFALPSPYDLYWKGDSQALGNPDLLSETSQGWQLWLENRLGAFRLKTSYHRNEIDNLIQWRQIQMFGNVWKPVNIGKARIQNLELEAGVQPLNWLSCSASALLTKALDLSSLPAETAPKLMYTPELSYNLELDISWNQLNAWSKYSFTGKQFTTPDNLADPLPSYSLLDLGVSYAIPLSGWTLSPFFSVHNLLDKHYEVYAYVPQPGISFYGGLSLKTSD